MFILSIDIGFENNQHSIQNEKRSFCIRKSYKLAEFNIVHRIS